MGTARAAAAASSSGGRTARAPGAPASPAARASPCQPATGGARRRGGLQRRGHRPHLRRLSLLRVLVLHKGVALAQLGGVVLRGGARCEVRAGRSRLAEVHRRGKQGRIEAGCVWSCAQPACVARQARACVVVGGECVSGACVCAGARGLEGGRRAARTCGWNSPPSRMRPGPKKILVRMEVSFSYFSGGTWGRLSTTAARKGARRDAGVVVSHASCCPC